MNIVKKVLSLHFSRFAIVAVVSLAFELTLYTLLFSVLKVDKVLSSPIAQVFSMVLNFSLNKFFTFQTSKKRVFREGVGYFLVWLINLFITTNLMALLLGAFPDIFPTIIRFGVIVVMFFFNFGMLKLFVFKKEVPVEDVAVA